MVRGGPKVRFYENSRFYKGYRVVRAEKQIHRILQRFHKVKKAKAKSVAVDWIGNLEIPGPDCIVGPRLHLNS